jgi:hypothetical protein
MATTGKWYANGLKLMMSKQIDLLNDSIKVMLVTSAYTPDQNTHIYKDVSITNEVSSANYTAGGVALGTKAINVAAGKATFSAANAAWTGVIVTYRHAIIYDDTPASNKPLLGYVTWDADQIASGPGNVTIDWDDTNGVLQLAG